MESNKSNHDSSTKSEEESANPISQFFLTWATSVVRKGFSKELGLEDLWNLSQENKSENAQPIIKKHFDENKLFLLFFFKIWLIFIKKFN